MIYQLINHITMYIFLSKQIILCKCSWYLIEILFFVWIWIHSHSIIHSRTALLFCYAVKSHLKLTKQYSSLVRLLDLCLTQNKQIQLHCLQELLVILKHSLQNYKKFLKLWFHWVSRLITGFMFYFFDVK